MGFLDIPRSHSRSVYSRHLCPYFLTPPQEPLISCLRALGFVAVIFVLSPLSSRFIQRASGLVDVNAQGNAIMRVDTTPQISGNRQSIRITTQDSFMGGLLIMDAVHMPTGCATWP
jgi:hypothetical protein